MKRSFAGTLVLGFILTQSAWAGVVNLKNGDRISGEILEDANGFLKVKTELLGEISINKDMVVVEAPAPVVEAAAAKVPKAWEHKVSAGYNTTNGNTKTAAANISLNSKYKKDRSEWLVKGSLDYASSNSRMTTQKFFGKAQSDYRLGEGSSWFNTRSVEITHDKFANVDYRILPAVGIGYWFWEGDLSKSEFDLGLGYEYTNYNLTDVKATGNLTLMPHYYVDKTLFGKSKISEDLTMYPSLESFADYRLRSETSLVNPLSETLSWKLSFIDEFNSAPASGAKKNDTTLMSSIEYAF